MPTSLPCSVIKLEYAFLPFTGKMKRPEWSSRARFHLHWLIDKVKMQPSYPGLLMNIGALPRQCHTQIIHIGITVRFIFKAPYLGSLIGARPYIGSSAWWLKWPELEKGTSGASSCVGTTARVCPRLMLLSSLVNP